jgi:deazaflavin-dependent oxidoreductase (nitroreductase family)
MKLQDKSVFVGKLTTIGRKTGQPRTVELRLVYVGSHFYASSSKVEGKQWCQNMLANPAVEVSAGSERYSCVAKKVTDENLRRRILALRDSPALTDRVVFEMMPQE